MRHLLASAVALCALGACTSVPAPYTKDTYAQHAKLTEIGKALGDDTLFPAVAESAFKYVMDNAFLDQQEALAITLIDNLADKTLRCRHDAPWMYGILDVATRDDKPSDGEKLVSAFKNLNANCINTSIFADGPTPLDAVLSNISHLKANNVWVLINMFRATDHSALYAPAVTLRLAQSMFSKVGERVETNIILYEAFLMWLNGMEASNFVAEKSMTTSAAVNPALVINLATMYNYGTTVLFFNGMESTENRAYKHQADMHIVALESFKKLDKSGQKMVNSILFSLGMIGFKIDSSQDSTKENGARFIQDIELHQSQPVQRLDKFKDAEFIDRYFENLQQCNPSISAMSANISTPIQYLYDGQFSLMEYGLFKAARSEAARIHSILKTYKVSLKHISPMAWEVFFQMVDVKSWNSFMTLESRTFQYYDMDFRKSLIYGNNLFEAQFTPAVKVKDALSTARCLAAASNLKQEFRLPELSSFCALPSDEATIVGRMRAYRRTLRNPLWVLVPSSHGHWPDAFWLHDLGCFFPVLGVRLALYYAGGISVLAALVLLLVRCCNRRIDKTKARYALPRPADE